MYGLVGVAFGFGCCSLFGLCVRFYLRIRFGFTSVVSLFSIGFVLFELVCIA